MPNTRTEQDEAAVRAVEAAYDAAWRAGDVDGLLACLSEDAVVVNPRGERASGHAEIRRELAEVLGGPALGSTHTSLIRAVDFITPDVAVVDGVAKLETQGEKHDAGAFEHRFTDILVRRGDGWIITHVRACPPASSPVFGDR